MEGSLTALGRGRLPTAALALMLSGCLAPAVEVAPASLDATAFDAVRAALVDLPCEATVGEGTSANLRELAFDPLDDLMDGSHGELAIWGSLAAVARYQTGGFDLLDVADPLAPRQLSTWDPEETDRSLDVKFTPDGATLVVGGDKAITLIDVREPMAPRVESVTVLEKPQAHMLSVFEIDHETYVAAVKGGGYDLALFRVVGEPGARVLESIARPPLTRVGETTGQDLLRSHDAWFTNDETLGKPLLWIANSWDGIIALDLTDPNAPVIISRIPPTDPYQGYTHTVQTTFLGERRLVVAVQEVGANALKVYDATDLAAPRLVGLWHVPVAAKAQHNLQLVGNLAFVAHYDEGTYVLDLADVVDGPLPSRLVPIARLATRDDGTSTTAPEPASGFGGTWDVVIVRGLLYTSEISEGLRISGFGCLAAGDEALSSTG